MKSAGKITVRTVIAATILACGLVMPKSAAAVMWGTTLDFVTMVDEEMAGKIRNILNKKGMRLTDHLLEAQNGRKHYKEKNTTIYKAIDRRFDHIDPKNIFFFRVRHEDLCTAEGCYTGLMKFDNGKWREVFSYFGIGPVVGSGGELRPPVDDGILFRLCTRSETLTLASINNKYDIVKRHSDKKCREKVMPAFSRK